MADCSKSAANRTSIFRPTEVHASAAPKVSPPAPQKRSTTRTQSALGSVRRGGEDSRKNAQSLPLISVEDGRRLAVLKGSAAWSNVGLVSLRSWVRFKPERVSPGETPSHRASREESETVLEGARGTFSLGK